MTVIDRFEGDLAVVETDSGIKTIPVELLPNEAREGDILEFVGSRYMIDATATAERRRRILSKYRQLSGSEPQANGDKYD